MIKSKNAVSGPKMSKEDLEWQDRFILIFEFLRTPGNPEYNQLKDYLPHMLTADLKAMPFKELQDAFVSLNDKMNTALWLENAQNFGKYEEEFMRLGLNKMGVEPTLINGLFGHIPGLRQRKIKQDILSGQTKKFIPGPVTAMDFVNPVFQNLLMIQL